MQDFFSHFLLLNPKGIIALKERNLMIDVTLLMLIIVIPVFVLTFYIVWKYRVDKKSSYTPNWDHNLALESVWWTIPCILIFVIGIITWRSSVELSPYKSLASSVTPITIQVVALDWKWLFIYPQQGIATVNYVEFPAGTPVNFQLTSDAPMNSFWIPQLGGQMYAMPGMSTQLHLESFKPGNFYGRSANISGEGFDGMKFDARAVSQSDFEQWITTVKQSSHILNAHEYTRLTLPSQNNLVEVYSFVDGNIYKDAVMKYMMPQSTQQSDMIMNK